MEGQKLGPQAWRGRLAVECGTSLSPSVRLRSGDGDHLSSVNASREQMAQVSERPMCVGASRPPPRRLSSAAHTLVPGKVRAHYVLISILKALRSLAA